MIATCISFDYGIKPPEDIANQSGTKSTSIQGTQLASGKGGLIAPRD